MGQHGKRPLRVLAVDDSASMRCVLRTMFEMHASRGDALLPPMQLCGLMRDGVEALEAIEQLAPDVLVLDVEMPRMNGLEVLARLRALAPALPVILCSASTERGARSTLDALSLGAKDYVMKPATQKDFTSALDCLMQQLLPRIAALAACNLRVAASRASLSTDVGATACAPVCVPVELVVIGVSTGGPSALEQLLPMLPRDFAAPVMIVQHMPRLFTGVLAERLDRMCSLRVQQASHGAAVAPGGVWLAPGDAHMEVAWGSVPRRNALVKLHRGPALNSCTPSVDYLFRSAAATYGAGTLALVMTGMGADGLEGARAIRTAGGAVLAQDQASSAVWGMPGRVAKEGLASALVPLEELAGVLIERVRQASRVPGSGGGMVPRHDIREVRDGML
jgi:two-component system chemotaxis response regulator CheB